VGVLVSVVFVVAVATLEMPTDDAGCPVMPTVQAANVPEPDFAVTLTVTAPVPLLYAVIAPLILLVGLAVLAMVTN
jgi:hypothetical protein